MKGASRLRVPRGPSAGKPRQAAASLPVSRREKPGFILSRSTAISLLRTRHSLLARKLGLPEDSSSLPTAQPVEVAAPVDFHKRQISFTFDPASTLPRPAWRDHTLSMSVLLQALKENLSYEVTVSRHANTEQLSYNPLRFESADGSVFTLSEAVESNEDDLIIDKYQDEDIDELAKDDFTEDLMQRYAREGKVLAQYGKESECIGSLLYMSNLKMHRTKGYATTTDFSKEFARAAQVQEGHVTLDLFLGLGYASQAALDMGAERVIAFEKYLAVQNLCRRNPWGMDLNDPSIASRFTLQTLDVQMEKSQPLFKFFQSYLQKGLMPSLFNNVILDPPKKKVMLYIYSPYFLQNLAEYVKRGGIVAAYMPPGGISPKFTKCREELVQTFQDTRKFDFIDCWDRDQMIWRFRRR